MAGNGFYSLDIRSEMASSGMDVETPVTTPTVEPSTADDLQIVVVEEPIPLEAIIPGEPGNEIDVENLPDFEALNRNFPVPPLP